MDTVNDCGWTIFQKRVDGEFVFHTKTFAEYAAGFGDASDEYWLGLENLYTMMSTENYQMQVEVVDADDVVARANYASFSLGNAADKYRLSLSGFSPGSPVDAGDSMSGGRPRANGQQFSATDEDNDNHPNGSIDCANLYTGAWWYDNCHKSNLNAEYHTPGPGLLHGIAINWQTWKGYNYALKSTKMKIKPTSA